MPVRLCPLTSSTPDFVPSPPKSVIKHNHELFNIGPSVFQSSSPFRLETHAFTAVKHKSIFHSPPYSKQSFLDRQTLSDVYYPELISLVKSVTGAKEVVIITTSVRSQGASPTSGAAADVSTWDMKGPMMSGVAFPLAPVRMVHIDYTPVTAKTVLRNFNPEVWGASEDIIKAEDEAAASGTEYKGRRYAFYSIWRPLETVRKDPLAVCDVSTFDRKKNLVDNHFKRPSLKGDYIAGIHSVTAEDAESQKWYWIKEQKVDEVLFLQFFDNYAEKEGRPIGVPHASPELLGIEGAETRESAETRVIAIW